MARIPWIVWIIVGIGMFFTAERFGGNTKIFMYVGIFFIAVGAFKMIVTAILGKGKEAPKAAPMPRSYSTTCPKCKIALPISYSFCPKCGSKIRG